MNNPLWTFSVYRYQQPGVAEACLEAQDYCGADVNLLFYAAWLASQQQALTLAQWPQLAALVAPWRQRVVEPLRTLRRDWRDLPGAQSLRRELQALELAAEESQQASIWAWHERSAQLAPATEWEAGLLAALDYLMPPDGIGSVQREALLERLSALFGGPGVA